MKILNKTKGSAKVRVKTREDTATEDEDFEKFDEIIAFED